MCSGNQASDAMLRVLQQLNYRRVQQHFVPSFLGVKPPNSFCVQDEDKGLQLEWVVMLRATRELHPSVTLLHLLGVLHYYLLCQ